jgi:hypothetical protein
MFPRRRRAFGRFAFLTLTIMTLSYTHACHDDVFLREHLSGGGLPFQRRSLLTVISTMGGMDLNF